KQTPLSRGRGGETAARRGTTQAAGRAYTGMAGRSGYTCRRADKCLNAGRTAPKEIGEKTVATSAHWRRCCLPTDSPVCSMAHRELFYLCIQSVPTVLFGCRYDLCSVWRRRRNAHTTLRHSESCGHSGHSCPFITARRGCTLGVEL